ncbi:MAG: hypothetical protein HY071_03680 [Chloroflexi bacterium]|nr:hypothetical protein [Chloroflexota bacterium]
MPGAPAAAATIDSAYRFESAFLSLRSGETGQLSVFFDNTGSNAWVANTDTQINLAACLADQVTCNVASDKGGWNPGTWTSSVAYATHAKASVVPGDFTAFTYSVKVPASAATGSYRFNGDLVLAATGQRIHPEGYFQVVSVSAPPPGAAAPDNLQTAVGNFNGGSNGALDDVRLTFTPPATNTITSYQLQRAPSSCPVVAASSGFVNVSVITAAPGVISETRDLDRPNGTWCYQVRTTEPTTGAFAYSNQAEATINVAADLARPVSTSAVLVTNGGNSGALDVPDSFTITFNKAMQLSATVSTTIRVTDADCGAPGGQGGPPAQCPVSTSQTVADIVCGANATCFLSFDRKTLNVNMTAAPRIVFEGTTNGVQYPVVFTDYTGISDLNGNTWDLTLSNDRSIGPAVGQ